MDYNSQKENLVISEYGRNVQNLIDHNKTIEDDKERQEFANAIVDLMHQMNPIHRGNADYKQKLWRHFFKIANYEINVTTPSGDIYTPESFQMGAETIPYPENLRKKRHYGRHVLTLIEKAKIMEDLEKKEEFIIIIASYMKIAYSTWSHNQYVNDEIIKQDLATMSDGELIVPADVTINVAAVVNKKRQPMNNNNKGRHRPSGGRNDRNNRNNNNRRRR